jgi:hypothetical protein
MAYDPKASSVTIEYMVKKYGDPFFLTATPDGLSLADRIQFMWANAQLLSPKGVEKVAA